MRAVGGWIVVFERPRGDGKGEGEEGKEGEVCISSFFLYHIVLSCCVISSHISEYMSMLYHLIIHVSCHVIVLRNHLHAVFVFLVLFKSALGKEKLRKRRGEERKANKTHPWLRVGSTKKLSQSDRRRDSLLSRRHRKQQ